MAKGFIEWLSQGYRTLKENAWLLGIITTIGLFGINLLRSEVHQQVSPLVKMVRWDFERRGIWKDYLNHEDTVQAQEKAFRPEPSASAGYPLFQFRGP